MAENQVIEVGGHHGAGIDHRVAQRMGLLALAGVDPHRRQAEGRVGGFAAGQRAGHAPRVDRHELPRKGRCRCQSRRP
jgi:hypothetical protein